MQWGQRYFKEGGTSAAIRTMLIQSQYLSGDFAGASKELIAEINAAERAGQRRAEDRLKLLLNAATQAERQQRLRAAPIEKLVTYYPKKEYWVDLLRAHAAQARLLRPARPRRRTGCRWPPAA